MTSRVQLLISLAAVVLVVGFGTVFSAEKIRFAASTRTSPGYYLPITVAIEQGFFKRNTLEVDYVGFAAGGPLYRAIAAGEIKITIASGPSGIQAVAAGLPLVMVAQVSGRNLFDFWLRSDSPRRAPADIKGAKIGITAYGSVDHIYSVAVARALRLEDQVRFVAVGGAQTKVAALRVGSIDIIATTPFVLYPLEVAGDVRRILEVQKYLPEPWVEVAVWATKDFLERNPDVTIRAVRSVVQAMSFVKENPDWTIEKMMSEHGWSREIARLNYGDLGFIPGGKINVKAVDNVKNWLVEYGLVPKEKARSTEDLFVRKFTE